MAAARAETPDKVSVVAFSGEFARVHYALVMASGAAAIGTPATLFFTMDACRMLTLDWRDLPASDGRTAGAADAGYAALGVATFDELLTACADMGVRFIVCDMGLRAVGLATTDLRTDLPIEIAGVVTFLADASADGVTVFV